MSTHSLSTLTLRAPAKINLFLHILGQKPNGYHTLQTLFQFVTLYDTLTIETRRDPQITFSGDTTAIPLSDQLVVKAAQLLQKTTGGSLGAHIHLEKTIPMEAGLGGGSSDAASTLLALNKLWDCRLTSLELQKLGLQLGADVPIFLYGHSAFASDIGETFQATVVPECWYAIAKPMNSHISTPSLFNHPDLPRNTAAIDFATYTFAHSQNDCEALVRRLHPPIDAVCQWLNTYGQARLTGTGACVFVALSDRSLWPAIQASCPLDCELWLCQGLNHSPALWDLAANDHAPALNE